MAIIKTAYYGEESGWVKSVEIVWKNEGDVPIRYTVGPSEDGSVVKTGDGGRYEDNLNFTHNYPDDTEKIMRIYTKTEFGVTSLYNYNNFLIRNERGLKFFTLANTPNLSSILYLHYNQNISKFTILNDINTEFSLQLHSSSIGKPYDEPDYIVSDNDFLQPGYDPLLDQYNQNFELYDPIPGFEWIYGRNQWGLRGYATGIALYGLQQFERVIPAADLKRYFAFSHQFDSSGYPYGHTRIELYQNGVRIYTNYYADDNQDYDGYNLGGNVGTSAFIFEITDFDNDLTIRIHSQEFQVVSITYSRVEYKFSDTPFIERPLDLSKIKGGLSGLTLQRAAWLKYVIFPDSDNPINNLCIMSMHYWQRGDPNRMSHINLTCPIKGRFEIGWRSRVLEEVNFYKDSLDITTGVWMVDCTKMKRLDLSSLKNFQGANPFYGGGGSLAIYSNPQLSEFVFPPNGYGMVNLANNDSLTTLDMLSQNFEVDKYFNVQGCAILDTIIHTPTTRPITEYYAYSCNLSGVHDLTAFTTMSGVLSIAINQITSILLNVQTVGAFSNINIGRCNFGPIADLTQIQNQVGGIIQFYSNPLLEEVAWSPNMDGTTIGITHYYGYDCNLQGVHDVSMFRFVDAYFRCYSNNDLTDVLFADNGSSLREFSMYYTGFASRIDLTHVEIWGLIQVQRTGITGIDLAPTLRQMTGLHIYATQIVGVIDLTMLQGGYNGYLFFYENPYVTRVDFNPNYVSGLITQCMFYSNLLLEGLDLRGHKFHPTDTTYIRMYDCPNATYLLLNLEDTEGTLYEVSIKNTQVTEIEWWPGAWDRTYGTGFSRIYVDSDYFDAASFNKFLCDLDKASNIIKLRYFYGTGTFPILDNISGGFDGSKAALSLTKKGWSGLTSMQGIKATEPLPNVVGTSKKLNFQVANWDWLDCGINKAWINFQDFTIEVKVSNLFSSPAQGIIGQSQYGGNTDRWAISVGTNGDLYLIVGNRQLNVPIPASEGLIQATSLPGGLLLMFNGVVIGGADAPTTNCSTAYRMLVGAYNDSNGGNNLATPALSSNVTIHHVIIKSNGITNILDLEEGSGDTPTWSEGDTTRIMTNQDINYINNVMWADDDSMLTDYDTGIIITKTIPIQVDYDAIIEIVK